MQLFATTLILVAPFIQLVHGVSERFICGSVTDKPSTPRYLRCKFEGSVVNERAVRTFHTSYTQCRNQCLESTICKAFSFAPDDVSADPQTSASGTCKTYHIRIVKQTSRKGQTGVFYWNRNCFNVDGYSKRVPIVNGNFQTGSLQPWEYDDPPVVLHEEDVNGTPNYSAKWTVQCPPDQCPDESTPYSKVIDQFLQLCGGVTYAISFDVLQPTGETNSEPNSFFSAYTAGSDGPKRLGGGYNQGGTSIYYSTEGSPSGTSYPAGTPFHVEHSFTPPTSDTYDLGFVVTVIGTNPVMTIQLDNVVVKATQV